MIGVGISTTPNRNVLDIDLWEKYIPGNFKLFVENDKEFTGVAATKNRLLSQLDDCDEIFLIDDDVVPLDKDWWKPYVENKELHLMYQFKLPGKPSKDMQEVYRDNEIVAYSHTRGAMIYLHRSILDMVGGFDEAYGLYGYEHADYTNRIHNFGLTTHRAMDVVGSDKLLYCLDQDNLVESSISKQERRKNMMKNGALYRKSKTSKEYKEYK